MVGKGGVGRFTPRWSIHMPTMLSLPVHLVVIVERAALLTPFPELNQSTFAGGSSTYPFVQNLVLAIRSKGLGASFSCC